MPPQPTPQESLERARHFAKPPDPTEAVCGKCGAGPSELVAWRSPDKAGRYYHPVKQGGCGWEGVPITRGEWQEKERKAEQEGLAL